MIWLSLTCQYNEEADHAQKQMVHNVLTGPNKMALLQDMMSHGLGMRQWPFTPCYGATDSVLNYYFLLSHKLHPQLEGGSKDFALEFLDGE